MPLTRPRATEHHDPYHSFQFRGYRVGEVPRLCSA